MSNMELNLTGYYAMLAYGWLILSVLTVTPMITSLVISVIRWTVK